MAQIGEVTIDFHGEEFSEALQPKIRNWLEAIGMDAASTAQGVCPVDTGRLKNSIYPIVTDDRTVIIGTNVEYGKYVELGDNYKHKTGGAHFLQFGATAHTAQYKAMLEDILKE